MGGNAAAAVVLAVIAESRDCHLVHESSASDRQVVDQRVALPGEGLDRVIDALGGSAILSKERRAGVGMNAAGIDAADEWWHVAQGGIIGSFN